MAAANRGNVTQITGIHEEEESKVMASASMNLSAMDNTPLMLRSAEGGRGVNRIQTDPVTNTVINADEETKEHVGTAIPVSRQQRIAEVHATMKTASFGGSAAGMKDPATETGNTANQIKEVIESERSDTEVNQGRDLSGVIVTEGE